MAVPPRVDGLDGALYAHAALLEQPVAPRTVLLSPFDDLVSHRAHTERSSTSSSGSRSTCRRRSAGGGTSCCRSCIATGWSGGWTRSSTRRTNTLRIRAIHMQEDERPGDRDAVDAAIAELARWLGVDAVTRPRRLAPRADPAVQRDPVEHIQLGGSRTDRQATLTRERGPGPTGHREPVAERAPGAREPARREPSVGWQHPLREQGAGPAPDDEKTGVHLGRRHEGVAADNAGEPEVPPRRPFERCERARRNLKPLPGRKADVRVETAGSVSGERGSSRMRCRSTRSRPEREIPEDAERLVRQRDLQRVHAAHGQPRIPAELVCSRNDAQAGSSSTAMTRLARRSSGRVRLPVPAPSSSTRSRSDTPACATSSAASASLLRKC